MKILAMNVGLTILIIFICLGFVGGVFALLWFTVLQKKFKKSNNIIENGIEKSEMMKEISTYIKQQNRFGAATFIFVDLDSFHSYIDVYGKKGCDDVLRIIAKRITTVLPHDAKIANLNLDEFLIFIKGEYNYFKNETLCKKLLDTIKEPVEVIEGEKIVVTASIGISTYPQAGDTLNDILESLEVSTYLSKREGGNRYTAFYASLIDDEKENLACYKEVKEAILKKQFVLYYQPIIDFNSKTVYGAEALMRWNHPNKGVIAAKDFISILEQSGDIHWVGEWGITKMIQFQKEMLQKFPNLPLTFSLNLSTKQLMNKNLAKNLITIAKKLNADPKRIAFEVEVIDFMVYEKISVVENNIKALKRFGFNVAVDGFDVDSKSVKEVQKDPIDIVKIGRSFLKDPDNNFTKEKLLVPLKTYVNNKGKQLISEGIENKKALKYIKKQGILLGSGYYFSKPVSQTHFEEYVFQMDWEEKLDSLL